MNRYSLIALTGILLTSSALAKPLEIVIHHRYGDAPLLMESARYESAAKETFSVTRPPTCSRIFPWSARTEAS